jgi:signal transduction histidine kinase
MRRDPVGQNVQVNLVGSDVALTGDGELLRAAFFNLFLNAAQAMDGKGVIRVTLAPDTDSVRIDVRDEGPGVPADLRERVFEPFFTTKARGGGLGLPIVRRTIDLHGGSIVLSCPPDGGTVVTLRLPLKAH